MTWCPDGGRALPGRDGRFRIAGCACTLVSCLSIRGADHRNCTGADMHRRDTGPDGRPIIGWREWVAFPELGIPGIKAKIDSGARTSALHTFQLETFSEDGCRRVRFAIHPLQRRRDAELFCTADVVDERIVRDSGGHAEKRLVIRSSVHLGDRQWPIEITLTNREDMLFRLLLGRSALAAGGMLVDPGRSYLGGPSLRRYYPPRRSKTERPGPSCRTASR